MLKLNKLYAFNMHNLLMITNKVMKKIIINIIFRCLIKLSVKNYSGNCLKCLKLLCVLQIHGVQSLYGKQNASFLYAFTQNSEIKGYCIPF